MVLKPLLGLLFLASSLCYWYLTIRTGLLSTRYFTQLGLLALSAASGIGFVFLNPPNPTSGFSVVLLFCVVLLALLSLVLFIVKLFMQPGSRMRSLHSLSRSFAHFNQPVRRFKLSTEDGVTIQAIQVSSSNPHENAIIVCHGGARSKDIQANVITCELLAEKYDVFTFDWRGHQESAGSLTGDGSSKYDLKAIIDHIKSLGYARIGVVSWSFGAWTAIIEGAQYKNFDAIVAAAPPPTVLPEAEMGKHLFAAGLKWWAWSARILLKAIRNLRVRSYERDVSLQSVIADLSPIPLLLVCNEFDTAVGVSQERFRQLFDAAGSPKEFAVLRGRGHIYDWPNTHHYLNLVQRWLEETL